MDFQMDFNVYMTGDELIETVYERFGTRPRNVTSIMMMMLNPNRRRAVFDQIAKTFKEKTAFQLVELELKDAFLPVFKNNDLLVKVGKVTITNTKDLMLFKLTTNLVFEVE